MANPLFRAETRIWRGKQQSRRNLSVYKRRCEELKFFIFYFYILVEQTSWGQQQTTVPPERLVLQLFPKGM
jgi:hypothetical protein